MNVEYVPENPFHTTADVDTQDMEGDECAPGVPFYSTAVLAQDVFWSHQESDLTPDCCGDGGELFGQRYMKFDCSGRDDDDDDNTNTGDAPGHGSLCEPLDGRNDWTMRFPM